LTYNGISEKLNRVRDDIGFVDQEDNMLGTMTVYEAVVFSALLRLPEAMPLDQKVARVLRVLKDLRIQHIADSYIGSIGHRGISGGEKRRVMVAMELVKIPKVLFLDEPTSGLDSFNASLLVDCLRDLAAHHKTNIVLTIHQPRSNIFHNFDRLLVLNKGEITYFGLTKNIEGYLESIGKPVPHDYNTADFLIDILFARQVPEPLRHLLDGSPKPVGRGRSSLLTPTSSSRDAGTSPRVVSVEIEMASSRGSSLESEERQLDNSKREGLAAADEVSVEFSATLGATLTSSPADRAISELDAENFYAKKFSASPEMEALLDDVKNALR